MHQFKKGAITKYTSGQETHYVYKVLYFKRCKRTAFKNYRSTGQVSYFTAENIQQYQGENEDYGMAPLPQAIITYRCWLNFNLQFLICHEWRAKSIPGSGKISTGYKLKAQKCHSNKHRSLTAIIRPPKLKPCPGKTCVDIMTLPLNINIKSDLHSYRSQHFSIKITLRWDLSNKKDLVQEGEICQIYFLTETTLS